MSAHQCPKCDLLFTWQTELDQHCREDHPQFQHEYPVHGVHHDYAQPDAATSPARPDAPA